MFSFFFFSLISSEERIKTFEEVTKEQLAASNVTEIIAREREKALKYQNEFQQKQNINANNDISNNQQHTPHSQDELTKKLEFERKSAFQSHSSFNPSNIPPGFNRKRINKNPSIAKRDALISQGANLEHFPLRQIDHKNLPDSSSYFPHHMRNHDFIKKDGSYNKHLTPRNDNISSPSPEALKKKYEQLRQQQQNLYKTSELIPNQDEQETKYSPNYPSKGFHKKNMPQPFEDKLGKLPKSLLSQTKLRDPPSIPSFDDLMKGHHSLKEDIDDEHPEFSVPATQQIETPAHTHYDQESKKLVCDDDYIESSNIQKDGCYQCNSNCGQHSYCKYPGVCTCEPFYRQEKDKCSPPLPLLKFGIVPFTFLSTPTKKLLVKYTFVEKDNNFTSDVVYCKFGKNVVEGKVDNGLHIIKCPIPDSAPSFHILAEISFDSEYWTSQLKVKSYALTYHDLFRILPYMIALIIILVTVSYYGFKQFGYHSASKSPLHIVPFNKNAKPNVVHNTSTQSTKDNPTLHSGSKFEQV